MLSLLAFFRNSLIARIAASQLVDVLMPFSLRPPTLAASGKKARRHGAHNKRPYIDQHEQHDLERQ